jgi:ADP-ribose pyrophosphatase YjhB (NUDIX family)
LSGTCKQKWSSRKNWVDRVFYFFLKFSLITESFIFPQSIPYGLGENGAMNKKPVDPNFIPDPLYSQITKLLPIVSVEALIVVDKSLLLLKRNNEPVKDEWWFPGGRIHLGESLEQTLRREIKEETSLELTKVKLFNVYSRVFPERHDITVAYLCKAKKGEVKLNNEHSQYSYFKKPLPKFHPCIAETIADSNWETF